MLRQTRERARALTGYRCAGSAHHDDAGRVRQHRHYSRLSAEVSEESKRWAEPLRQLLLEIKREVEEVRAEGGERPAAERLSALTFCYEQLVGEGLKANPPPEAKEQVKKQARNLLLRLQRRQAEVLKFMTDFRVPFDNNQAERDLRMVKLRQKTSGCFRTAQGATNFCRIRSYLSSVRKQGKPVLKALQRACQSRSGIHSLCSFSDTAPATQRCAQPPTDALRP